MRKLFLLLIAATCTGATLPLYIDTDTNTVVSPDAPTTLSGYGITDAATLPVDWVNVTNTPTTLDGYGITDGATLPVDWFFISNTPTTLAGYGITDGLPQSNGENYFLTGNGSFGWDQMDRFDAQISLSILTNNGGAQIGTSSSADTGAALGAAASAVTGGAIGDNSSSTTGGAIGNLSSATSGAAVGNSASSTTGGAVGDSAIATTGGAVGDSAIATTGFSGGDGAVSFQDGAVQLGAGTNSDPNTIQFRDSGPVTAAQFGALAAPKSGFADYNDSTGSVSITADTWTDVPNDGAGAFTNTSYLPSGVTSLLDTSTGYLDFSDLSLGSEILIRNDLTVVPQTNNALLEVRYLLGTGAGEYQLLFWSERLDSGSGIDYQRVVSFPIYMGDTNTQGNPGKLQIRLSSSGTFTNAGSYISIRIR